jgi:uncharacterized protein YjbI with pentapeptide repeats
MLHLLHFGLEAAQINIQDSTTEVDAAVADNEHIRLLKQGSKAWNAWRRDSIASSSHLDLSGAELSHADLSYADLSGANLTGTNLSRADLNHADLSIADLIGANLSHADLSDANLSHADLSGANLREADLSKAYLVRANVNGTDLVGANLSEAVLVRANLSKAGLASANLHRANLSHADLTGAVLAGTLFANVSLTDVIGLETCLHVGPSTLDHLTLQNSGLLPIAFLRGVGLSDRLIDYLPSLLDQAIQRYSCFISYSTKDQDFANHLHADLQNEGVRCWFAPHDLPIGGKILDEIDAAIRLRDKVVLILSEHSIMSDWVEDEVKTAYEEERRRRQTVLFPIRLDDVVMGTNEAWAAKLRADRNIGDFRRWKDHDAYTVSFERVMRDLVVRPKDGA